MGKILSFPLSGKKSVKQSTSYLEYMKGIMNGHKTNKLLIFPYSKRILKNDK